MKVLVLFSSSLGEIDWILPVLVALKRDYGAQIVANFHTPQLYAKLGQNIPLAKILRETAQIFLEPRRHVFTEHKPESFDVVLKDDVGDSFMPQRAPYLEACHRAKQVVFPCSGFIYGLTGDTPNNLKAIEKKVATVMGFSPITWGKSDLCLCGSVNDFPALSLRYAPKSIRAVGFPRYDMWWVQQLLKVGQKNLQREQNFLADRRSLLFVIRGPHPLFLTPKDYSYLMRSFCEVVQKIPGLAAVIKPHPRQSEEDLVDFLSAFPSDKFLISHQPIMLLSSLVEAVVCMLTSGVLDVLRVGKPTVEFFIYPQEGRECLEFRAREKGGYESIYHQLGLVASISRRSQLKTFIEDIINGTLSVKFLEQNLRALGTVVHQDDLASARAAAHIDAVVAGRPF